MTSKKDQTSSKKDSNKQGKQPNDSAEDIAMLIKRAMAAEMETFQETVALMLNESLEKALDPIQKHMAENGNILRSLKEQADIHAKKFSTVFNQIDSIQVSLRKTNTPFTRWENAYIFMRFCLSFTRKLRFYHGKRSFLKTPAKVEISENTVFVFACELGQTEF